MKLTHNNKPNKNAAFDILIKIKKIIRQDTEMGVIGESDLDSLINYFTPTIPKIPKTAEQWVAKACGTKDVRYYLNYLYVENGVAYGTDGHRMHWCDTKFDDGFYDPKTLLPTECDGKYPDVSRFMLDKNTLGELLTANLSEVSEIFRDLHCYNLNNHYFQQKYINDALSGFKSINYYNKDDRIYSQSKFGQFVMISMRP